GVAVASAQGALTEQDGFEVGQLGGELEFDAPDVFQVSAAGVGARLEIPGLVLDLLLEGLPVEASGEQARERFADRGETDLRRAHAALRECRGGTLGGLVVGEGPRASVRRKLEFLTLVAQHAFSGS